MGPLVVLVVTLCSLTGVKHDMTVLEREAVFQTGAGSETSEVEARRGEVVCGYDFHNSPLDFTRFLSAYKTMGFQGTALGKAIEVAKKMRQWRDPDDPEVRCTIFLGYTSNMVSSGCRELIRYLVERKYVDVLVTTAGGVEEDFIKCLQPTHILSQPPKGDNSGDTLRSLGINRIGNLMIENANYCQFEDWLMPILDDVYKEQIDNQNTVMTPSKLIDRLGREIDDPRSIYYHASKNEIPVFSPALTDGSLGDMLYFHTFRCGEGDAESGITLDIVRDVRKLNSIAVKSKATGMIILGGGVVKHHICNANLMRNGADFAVFINTGQAFDGSDSGADPDEAVSWGKLKGESRGGQFVKVCCDATIAFPLLVAGAFCDRV